MRKEVVKNGDHLGVKRADLPTPCLLLDRDQLDCNLRNMQKIVASHGKQLRAHAKTHKCSRLAARQIACGAVGICAAKASEARGLIAAGIRGVLLTSPAITAYAQQLVVECAEIDPGFAVTLDDLGNADGLAAKFASRNRRLRCLLDVDANFGRTGIPLTNFRAFAEAAICIPGLEIVGVQAYAGHVQHIADFAERREVNRRASDVGVRAFEILKELGVNQPIFSVGGTGSHMFDVNRPEVTEIQAGSYALMDAEYLAISSAESRLCFDDFPPALTLLTTVVSANQPAFVTVDAGLKALYRDGATPIVVEPGLQYDWFGDEFGKISGDPASLPRLGEQLSLVVSHCDPTVNLFDQFFVIEDGVVVDVWPIDLRGCSQ